MTNEERNKAYVRKNAQHFCKFVLQGVPKKVTELVYTWMIAKYKRHTAKEESLHAQVMATGLFVEGYLKYLYEYWLTKQSADIRDNA